MSTAEDDFNMKWRASEETKRLGPRGSEHFERFCAVLWDGMLGARMGGPKWAELANYPQHEFRATVRNAFAVSAKERVTVNLLWFADLQPKEG